MHTVNLNWTDFKNEVNSRGLKIQYYLSDITYHILAFDDKLKFYCKLEKENPSSSDQTDFETNYRDAANKKMQSVDSDGSTLTRAKITATGWQYHIQGIQFTTSDLSSLVSKDEAGNDIGFSTYKLYDDTDTEITQEINEVNAVKTVIDWEPTFDYEIIGGALKMMQDTTQNIYAYVTAVPDIPANLGGSKDFICCVNMKFIKNHDEIRADGRSSKKLLYDAVNHTNKMRITLKHPAGVRCEYLMLFEIFKE